MKIDTKVLALIKLPKHREAAQRFCEAVERLGDEKRDKLMWQYATSGKVEMDCLVMRKYPNGKRLTAIGEDNAAEGLRQYTSAINEFIKTENKKQMITPSNYYNRVAKLGVNTLPEVLKKSHEFVDKVTGNGATWNTYNSNETIKRVVDLYLEKLNAYAGANSPAVKSKPTVAAKVKKIVPEKETKKEFVLPAKQAPAPTPKATVVPEQKHKATKAAKPKKATKTQIKEAQYQASEKTERLTDDVSIIKRYISFHTKTKTKDQCYSFLKAVQKAILEKRVGKSSMYGKEVMQIQDSLRTLVNDNTSASFEIIIGDNSLERYREIADSIAPLVSIALLKRYVGLIGKKDIKEKVERLAVHFDAAFNKRYVLETDKYVKQVREAYTNLQNYIAGNTKTLFVEEQELNGLQGIIKTPKADSVMQRIIAAENIKKNPFNYRAKILFGEVVVLRQLNNTPIKKVCITNAWKDAEYMASEMNKNAKASFKDTDELGNPIAFAASAIAASYLQTHIKNGIEKLFPRKKATTIPSPLEGKGLVNGLSGPEVMTVAGAKAQSFKKIGFTGKLHRLIGDACEPTSIFIYGNGGSGKSSLSLLISDELNKLGKSVLYVAGEQFNTPSFSRLLEVTNISGNERFKIVKSLNTLPLASFDVIVIDSKDSIGLTASSDFKTLRDNHPKKIWIITSQGTKAGDFSGDEKWRNEVDTMVYCERGTASTLNDKNRWGGKATVQLF